MRLDEEDGLPVYPVHYFAGLIMCVVAFVTVSPFACGSATTLFVTWLIRSRCRS